MAGLAGIAALLGKETPFDRFQKSGFDQLNNVQDRYTREIVQNLINSGNLNQIKEFNKGKLGQGELLNKGLLERQNLIGDQNLKITDKNIGGNLNLLKESLGNQDKWRERGLNSFKEAGLPDFAFFQGGGGLNIGSTRSYVGGNNYVNSLGTPGTKLPTSGSSPWADMNGLSKPF